MFARLALALATAALLSGLLMATGAPERAGAAPCPTPTYSLSAGEFSLEGPFACSNSAQEFKVYCTGGQVYFDYRVSGILQGTTNTAIACAAPTHMTVNGGVAGDTLDLGAVTGAAGFSSLTQPNLLRGGSGNDLIIGSGLPDRALGASGSDALLLRDGVADVADCGDGFDTAQTDPIAVDSVMACEFLDVAPTPAKKKCKKRKKSKRAAAAKKCAKKKR